MDLRKIWRLSLALLTIIAGLDCARAENASSYFTGKTVTIVVGSEVGSIYDIYARLLGRYLGKHIPGDPSVIVSNMPGAGSENAAAYVARVAAKDGTYIAATNQNQPLDPILASALNLNYDPSRMNYLGNASSDVSLCIVRSDAPATTFDAMFKTQVIVGATAAGVPMAYLPNVLDELLGTKFKVVLGYPGAAGIILAMQKGEVQGLCGISWGSLMPQYKDLIDKGAIKIVVQASDKGLPELNRMGVPLTASYEHDDEQRRILDILYSQEIFARPYFAAAEVPPDRLAILRRAFLETWRDPDLLADAAKMNVAIGPMSGEEIQSLLQTIYATPPALLQRVKELIKLQ